MDKKETAQTKTEGAKKKEAELKKIAAAFYDTFEIKEGEDEGKDKILTFFTKEEEKG